MKRFLFGFLAVLFLILNTIPYLHIMADSSMTNAQYKQVGAFALSSLITTGEATELDFSDYTSSDTDLLLALGEFIVTGDTTGLVECGLDWLGETIDDAYDSAIQSIRTWEYNNLPDSFYYWFIDENPPYELAPSYNNIRDLSQPLRKLITPPENSVVVNPNPDFSALLSNISSYMWNDPPNYVADLSNVDWCYNLGYAEYPLTANYPFSFVVGAGVTWKFYDVGTIYVTTNPDNTVSARYNFPNKTVFVNTNNVGTNWSSALYFENKVNGVATKLRLNQLSINSHNLSEYAQSDFAGISTAMNYYNTYFRHCNLIVDGDYWCYVGGNDYPIIVPDQLTIWNDQPLEYTFPQDTYLKLPDLTSIITNAINNSGVVMWSDIADCFVDVNGQTAIAVTKIVRNDYDNLYMEQYPYPAMLPGMTEQTKFNEHLLDNSHAYLSPINTVVEETVNVLPSELVGVLAIGAILTIFAVIINRLLE